MAQDSWMLERVRQINRNDPANSSMPKAILRFYQWSQPTLSLGFHQSTRSLPALSANMQLDWVRRPTGGRAVLHQAIGLQSDLTYSLAIAGTRGSRSCVYRSLCQFLLQGIAGLGIELDFGKAGRGYAGEASCFRTATSADLCWQGRKVIGSAQLWRGSAVLQHGTILLQPDRATWDAILPNSSQAIVGLNEIGSRSITVPNLISSLTAAVRTSLDFHWQDKSLDPGDREAIEQSSSCISSAHTEPPVPESATS
ncbi:MAG: lipoate--protein ligase family protein [Cyanobacteria bacterium P01_F01_bin.33]